ncbi:alpha-(1,6)-fucosyltransferase-like [Ixodes scapularis]|uniref:alpha-(1,6)-fucosyltransferase-like n=1 Tax=Ixodes scapularis TaxID=6945 RepID=UPI001C3905E2|nr:alpha-(1,6)-fucosyltransferase-like [Ixodes scapularis]
MQRQNIGDMQAATYLKLQHDIKDIRRFLAHHMGNVKNGRAAAFKSREFLRVIQNNVEVLKRLEGVNDYVSAKMAALQSYVQRTISSIQNPSNCTAAPKLLCRLTNPYGLASAVHDLLWCFVAALRTGRTLILDSTMWKYAPGRDWLKSLLPVTGAACTSIRTPDNETEIYMFPGTRPRKPMKDLPSAIVATLVANNGDPYAWWYGQIMSYALRVNNSTLQKIHKFKVARGYEHPIVGVHIRRRDENVEEAYHAVDEYMFHVEEFYSKLSLVTAVTTKRVFLATDDPYVTDEFERRFPEYELVTAKRSSRSAAERSRSTFFDALLDLQLLADSDFLVCTMSSGFCRVAYELMQVRHPDASLKTVSLDVEYFFAFVSFPPRKTLEENRPALPHELGWSGKGQLIEAPSKYVSVDEAVKKKFADGFSMGRVQGRATKDALSVFPRFKTTQTYSVADYAAFAAPPSQA